MLYRGKFVAKVYVLDPPSSVSLNNCKIKSMSFHLLKSVVGSTSVSHLANHFTTVNTFGVTV